MCGYNNSSQALAKMKAFLAVYLVSVVSTVDVVIDTPSVLAIFAVYVVNTDGATFVGFGNATLLLHAHCSSQTASNIFLMLLLPSNSFCCFFKLEAFANSSLLVI